MKIHKLSCRLVRALAIFVGVLGAITLFTNTSFTGGQTLASAAECVLNYDSSTKTLTVGPGDLPTDFRTRENVSSAETIVFVSAGTSETKVVAPQNSESLFYNLTKLKSFQGMQNLDTSNVTKMGYIFRNCNSLTQLNLSGFNTSKVTSMGSMFQNCTSLTQLDLSGFNTSNVTTMSTMFNGCTSLTQLDLSGFDTSKVLNMYYMFVFCSSLTQLDLSVFNTSKVTNMGYMFADCTSLTQLNLSEFNTSQVTNMYGIFGVTRALWKLTLGPDFVSAGNTTLLLDPVIGTPFQQNYRNDTVSSPKWLNVQTGSEYTAAQIPTAHVQGATDTYIWQGHENTTVEYVVQPTYTITIPATITIPSATVAGTGNVTLSAYPKVPYENRFIHISATSENANSWHLTTTGDTTGAEYDFSAEGEVNLKAGSDLVLEADGEAPAKTKIVSASLTDNTNKFKYAGAYKDIVTFTIQTAASAS
ncbi:MAG: DUF285 domain-containing protein [Lactobacillaceae bacterium]|jgi:surface protein|nr:DUF285 domain-containing protein [Lactobacillaceae bacterium]